MSEQDKEILNEELEKETMETPEAENVKENEETAGEADKNAEIEKLNLDADVHIEECLSQVGGGSMPLETMKSRGIAITPNNMNVSTLERKLRLSDSHIIARVYDNKYVLDVRTIFEDEFADVANELKLAFM